VKKFILYTSLRKFGDNQLSAPIQNLILRDYCKKKNILFSLPVEEYIFENCYAELEGIISNLKNVKGIIMCSYEMLPNNEKYLNFFFKKMKNLETHFILEKIIINKKVNYIKFLNDVKINKNILKIANNIDLAKLKKFI
jgi:sporadic carbohydrate cluster protein (TIGR04323 family)